MLAQVTRIESFQVRDGRLRTWGLKSCSAAIEARAAGEPGRANDANSITAVARTIAGNSAFLASAASGF